MRASGVWEFGTLISCYDYRMLDNDPKEKIVYINRLNKYFAKKKIYIMHLSYTRPLRVAAIAGVVYDSTLWKRLLSSKITTSLLGRLGVPKLYYISRIVLSPGKIVIWWHRPLDLSFKDVQGWVDEYYEGMLVPVQTCKSSPELRDVPRLGKRLATLTSIGEIKVKTYVMPLVLLSLLDKYRLTPLRRLLELAKLAKARNIAEKINIDSVELRWKYVKKYYDLLSEHNVLGRYRVISRDVIANGYSYLIYTKDSRCFENVYGFLAYRGTSGHVFYSDNILMSSAVLLKGDIKDMLSVTDPMSVFVEPAVKIYGAPFPYEMYNPVDNRWCESPNDSFIALLRKIGVIKKL